MKTQLNSRSMLTSLSVTLWNRGRSWSIGLSMIAALVVGWMPTAMLQAKTIDHPPIICAFDEATEQMKCELKDHFRRVPGYGRMIAANAQLRARVASIGRRIQRDPYYRNLARDLARSEEYSVRLVELIQEVLSCPDSLRRAEGNIRGVTAQANRLLDLTAELRRQLSPYCETRVEVYRETYVAPETIVAAVPARVPVYREPYADYGHDDVYAPPLRGRRPCPSASRPHWEDRSRQPKPYILDNQVPFTPRSNPFERGSAFQDPSMERGFEVAPGTPKSTLPRAVEPGQLPSTIDQRNWDAPIFERSIDGADITPRLRPPTPSLNAPQPRSSYPAQGRMPSLVPPRTR